MNPSVSAPRSSQVVSQPVLVTGAAGFIGMHVCLALLRAGTDVIGIDRLVDPGGSSGQPTDLELLRRARLAEIERVASNASAGFTFREIDIARPGLVDSLSGLPFDRIVHLAAQAGVRFSIERPDVYVQSNLVGTANLLEVARERRTSHFVFASSSSVYGGRVDTPFLESDRIDRPVSFYAATKVANEAMAASYSHLFRIASTGLRFFTVYGPWGRPDMAPWLFTQALLEGRPINVFGEGRLLRDFTYVDDIVNGLILLLDSPPASADDPFVVYNIGNHRAVTVNDFLQTLEALVGRKAIRNEMPVQPGDVPVTCASIDQLKALTGFQPTTSLKDGLTRFVDWYMAYRALRAA